MYLKPNTRLAVYAEGEFGKGRSKTAEGVLRYGKNPIAAVIDSTAVGKTIKESIRYRLPGSNRGFDRRSNAIQAGRPSNRNTMGWR